MAQYYTNGNELRYINGDPYIGYYIFDELGIPYAGTSNAPTTTELYYINKNQGQVSSKIFVSKFNKNSYKKKYKTEFNELINTNDENNVFNTLADENTLDISRFFDLYNKIFYDIPKDGSINSHESIIKQSSEYINFTPNQDLINTLQNEISSLREQLLEEQKNNTELLNSINK